MSEDKRVEEIELPTCYVSAPDEVDNRDSDAITDDEDGENDEEEENSTARLSAYQDNIPLLDVLSETSISKEFKAKSIHEICRDGDVRELENYFNLDKDDAITALINALDEKDVSPLHYAVRYTNIEITESLLIYGADPNLPGPDQMTPLQYAARYGGKKRSRFWKRGSFNSADEGAENTDDDGLDAAVCEKIDLVSDSIDLLLKSGAYVNAKDMYGLTALHHAAIRGNNDAATILLKAIGVDKEPRDLQRSTPLHLASTYNRLETVKLFLDENANPKTVDVDKRTPLHEACQEGNSDIVDAIIFHSESQFSTDFAQELITLKDSEGNTPLSLAISSGSIKSVKRLLEYGANPNSKNKHSVYAIHCAARTGDIDVVKELINCNAEVNSVNKLLQTPIYLAALNNNVEVIQFLSKNGANLNLQDSNGWTPLHVACKEGHVEAVEALLEAHARPQLLDFDDRSILFLAATYNRSDVIQALLDHEECNGLMNVNDLFDNLPLHVAAKEGNSEVVRLLINAGSDIDTKNEDEKTALHLAALYGRVEVVDVILKSDRCAISDIDEDSNTPLHIACTHKRFLVSKKLLDYGAEIQSRNVKKWTPLDCAAASGAYKCVQLLLENGAQIDPLDRSKTTPLHLASEFGHEKTVRMLLSNGASLKMEDAFGRNALEIAILKQKRSVVKVLIECADWEDAFRTCLTPVNQQRYKVPETPLRLLIKTYPELVENVLDSCITTVDDPDESKAEKVVMNYEFLDDAYLWNPIDKDTKMKPESYKDITFEYCKIENNTISEPFPKPYHSNGKVVNINHPLMIMAKERNRDLLRHPLCLALVRHKWRSFGRYVFYGRIFLYCLFLIFLTSYLLLEAQSSFCFDRVLDHHLQTSQSVFKSFCHIGVLIGVILNIFAEVTEIIRTGIRYISFDNMLDWVVCILSLYIIFTDSLFFPTENCSKWDVSAILISLAWLNLLADIRQLPYLGIYVIMFFDILLTFTKFGTIFMVFIIAFGLGFHFIDTSHDPFQNPGDSFLKTTVMMIGEYDYGDMFFPENESDPRPGSTHKVYFGVFIVVMSLIVMNLLVGLAVEDIKVVQEQAVLKRLVMQAELVLDVERHLPNIVRRMLSITTEEIKTKKKRGGFSWLLSDMLSSSNIIRNVFEYNSEPDISDILTRQHQSEEKMKKIEKDIKSLRTSTEEIKNILLAIADKNQVPLLEDEFTEK